MSLVNMFGNKIPDDAGGSWTPAELFLGTEKGLWWDVSDISTLFQDTAGLTPVTADGQSVNRINDKSGNGENGIPTGTSTPPTYRTGGGNPYLECDGVDTTGNGLDVASPSLSSDMDNYIVVYRVSADGKTAFTYSGLSQYYALCEPGAGSAAQAGSGSPSYVVDGAATGGTTRGDLHTALTTGVKHVLETTGADLTSWASGFRCFGYSTTFSFEGRFYGQVLRDSLSAPDAALLRTYMNTL